MIIQIIIMAVIMGFVDRGEELSALRSRLNSSKFELIVIYGREGQVNCLHDVHVHRVCRQDA